MSFNPIKPPRRGVLFGLGAFVAAPALAQSGSRRDALPAILRGIGIRPVRAEAHYRGVHYGTHSAVHYEIWQELAWINRGSGARLEVIAEETHDGDVLDGPNAVPRSRRETIIDLGAKQVLREGLTVIDKPVDWRFDYDRGAGTVSGHMERYGPRTSFAGPVAPNTTSGDGLTHLIASLPLAPEYAQEFSFIAPGSEGMLLSHSVRIAVARSRFIRLGGEAVPVYRVEVTSATPFLAATGVYLTRTEWPHLVLRAEYQSTHIAGEPPFDSRGCDILTDFRLIT